MPITSDHNQEWLKDLLTSSDNNNNTKTKNRIMTLVPNLDFDTMMDVAWDAWYEYNDTDKETLLKNFNVFAKQTVCHKHNISIRKDTPVEHIFRVSF